MDQAQERHRCKPLAVAGATATTITTKLVLGPPSVGSTDHLPDSDAAHPEASPLRPTKKKPDTLRDVETRPRLIVSVNVAAFDLGPTATSRLYSESVAKAPRSVRGRSFPIERFVQDLSRRISNPQRNPTFILCIASLEHSKSGERST